MINLASTEAEMMSFFETMSMEEFELRLAACSYAILPDSEVGPITVGEPQWLKFDAFEASHVVEYMRCLTDGDAMEPFFVSSGDAMEPFFVSSGDSHWAMDITPDCTPLFDMEPAASFRQAAESPELALAA